MKDMVVYGLSRRSWAVKVVSVVLTCLVLLAFILALAFNDIAKKPEKYGPELIVGLIVLWAIMTALVTLVTSLLVARIDRKTRFMLAPEGILVEFWPSKGVPELIPYASIERTWMHGGPLLSLLGLRAVWVDTSENRILYDGVPRSAAYQRTERILKTLPQAASSRLRNSWLENWAFGFRYLSRERAEQLVAILDERRRAERDAEEARRFSDEAVVRFWLAGKESFHVWIPDGAQVRELVVSGELGTDLSARRSPTTFFASPKGMRWLKPREIRDVPLTEAESQEVIRLIETEYRGDVPVVFREG